MAKSKLLNSFVAITLLSGAAMSAFAVDQAAVAGVAADKAMAARLASANTINSSLTVNADAQSATLSADLTNKKGAAPSSAVSADAGRHVI